MTYEAFVDRKLARVPPTGIPDAEVDSSHLFDFQRDLVQWALRRGRASIFADTGLGKSRMELAWCARVAEHTGKPSLILAPLAVARQTQEEGRSIGIDAVAAREQSEISLNPGIVYITNYERIHRFDPSAFGAVALDESSIIKHHHAKTLRTLMDAFADTPFRLCCTATPSPNDYTELGTHAEFLGVCTRAEMLSEFFVHDGGETQKWRLKGHARHAFWRFIASWAALVRSPADLGYDASAYELPPLRVEHRTVESDEATVRAAGTLFAMPASTLMERRQARKASIAERVRLCAEHVNRTGGTWVVWCDLNDESTALTRAIDGAIEVTGSLDADEKERRLYAFASGEARVIVSKPSLAGFGLNWQHCNQMAFVGVTDSWESYYQAVRRIWRFGQRRECNVVIWASDLEGSVIANLQRKEADAQRMASELSAETAEMVRAEVRGVERATNDYSPAVPMRVPDWCVSEHAPVTPLFTRKLSDEQVAEIREKKASGSTLRALAAEYGLSPSTVSDICTGKKRKSV